MIYNHYSIETTWVSINRQVHKENMVWIDTDIYNGILLSHINVEIVICDNMDGPWGNVLSEKNLTEKDICPYDLMYMWNPKQRSKAHRYKEQIASCHWQG